jgi:guanyl-specific ribonuclease Sa
MTQPEVLQMKKPQPWRVFSLVLLLFFLCGLLTGAWAKADVLELSAADFPVTRDGSYSSLEKVAVYLATFGELPGNFITKREAQDLGWNSREGNLYEVAPGYSIGGDFFGNYEENPDLPRGKKWTECDINSDGGFRGGERIVFTQDGLIYYTGDHYNHFTQVLVTQGAPSAASRESSVGLREDGAYTSKEEVAAFIRQFAALPYNYLTKDEARELGWANQKDNLGQVAPGYAIGGDSFGNREGLLPNAKNRVWWECDVNVEGGKRSRERLVFSNDGLIYYTSDNYRSFEKLY